MGDVVIAGAGMAGLVAAAQARALGAEPAIYEKGDRPGGSMALSSGVIWRHRRFADFRAECHGGQEPLQRLVHERLDADLDWLQELGAPLAAGPPGTGNPHTAGRRFDPPGLVSALCAATGPIRLGQPLTELPAAPLVLGTGGFAANRDLVRAHITAQAEHLLLRASPWSTGDGLRLGTRAGAERSAGLHEFYGRALPAPPARIAPAQFVALAQLYARHAEVTGPAGGRYRTRAWSEIDVVQWIARQPGARARYTVGPGQLGVRVGERTVAEMVAAAEAAGAAVERHPDGRVTVPVAAGITTTLGGLRAGPDGRVAPGVFAAGNDVGGIATGGYSSGLAAALVLGRIAGRSAVQAARRGEAPAPASASPGPR